MMHTADELQVNQDLAWERAAHVMEFPNGDGTALHDMDADEYFQLPGPVAVFVWNHCDGLSTTKSLLQAVLHEFDVDEDTAQRDLIEFLHELNGRRLLTSTKRP